MAARKRKESESFEQYRDNLKAEGKAEQRRLRGRVVWFGNQGTYVRAQHGKI